MPGRSKSFMKMSAAWVALVAAFSAGMNCDHCWL